MQHAKEKLYQKTEILEFRKNKYKEKVHQMDIEIDDLIYIQCIIMNMLSRYQAMLNATPTCVILKAKTFLQKHSSKNANTKELKLVYSEYQLEQLIRSYTRVAMTTTESRG